ncbi:MAG: flagellar basal body rod protein FlgC [Sedimentisphaerales bacterium]|nr:flagellar basal body rod protein FlgC [Sedimentisphaerales bacterium]
MRVDGDMFGTLDIAMSGLRANRKHVDVITSNVVNARTTDVGNGQPYRRLEAIFKASDDGISGVEISEVTEDMSEFERVLKPGHPQADAEGYVQMPNVNLPQELISLNMATRAYEASAAILKRYQKMVQTSLELLK